jgi:fructokinase
LYICDVFRTADQQDKNDESSMTHLVEAIFEIAQKSPDGFTVEVPSLKPVISGYIAACQNTQNCFGRKGLEKVLKHALENGNVVGGWKNTGNGKYYFDSSKVFNDKEAAIAFGKANGQLAIIDLSSITEIWL